MFVCPKCRSIYSSEAEFCGIDGHRLVESEEDPLIGLEIDRYEIVSRLGTGAMGYVYLAEHKILDSKRAFKLLFGELAADRRAMNRFQREAQALSKIRHPNIVSIVDFGTTPDGLTFLAMEYIDGQTLEDLIEAEGKLSSSRIANITRQISSGLAEAHKLGFVHRDLKPGNVMLSRFDDVEQVKVLDFGLVAIADEAENATKLTKTGYTLGTPRYLAPEQSQSAEVTSSADLYSLGVILYEMIAGQPPFVGDMKTVIMQHLCEAPPLLPATDGLEALAMSLLEKEPEHRPAGASEVVAIVDELAGKLAGSDLFLSLRSVSDPRGSIAPRRASTPGIDVAVDGETLEKLATAQTSVRRQDSWAPQLPLTDTAATGPSLEAISTISRIDEDRLIHHPKKIAALVGLIVFLAGLGFYIADELGMLRVQTAGNNSKPIHVAKKLDEPVPVIEAKEAVEEPTKPELEAPKPKLKMVSETPKRTKARSPAIVKEPVEAASPTPETLNGNDLKQLDGSLMKKLNAKGLKLSELKSHQDLAPFFTTWLSSRTGPAKLARSNHKQLLQNLEAHNVQAKTLQKRLKGVHAALVRAAEKLGSSTKVADFEEQYLEFDNLARGASTPKAREKIASQVLRLERKIEALNRTGN